ncbi:tyrosine-type recombinase/integrase [Streptomyces sp. Isolate_219]|uniref:tyrosine-type recombinase/integrase n=1 Tax=Streptomyces sp. Isolate_219 TaxID=2950110 RepID=UPI0021CA642B|nr:tyrosine-type recombinase/integrase [Streptomyces sp. Isolate_219]MCR8574282.1 tyrosine-type recombinase/integrase [Streptomyces sp. Isolate_219]
MYKTAMERVAEIPGLAGNALGVLERADATTGMPFLIGPDGTYDLQLNRFFRELGDWGVRAMGSVEAYARDLALFCRFLHQHRGGKAIWDADQQDLLAYRRARRRTPGFEVSAATWNRFLAALDKWVAWALDERQRLLSTEPFRMVEKTIRTPRGLVVVRTNALREVDEDPGAVEFLAFEDYLLWRDVGLRGQLPSGEPDPSWRGRHGERNAAFADLVVGTGMRLQEASSLLVTEIPSAVDGRRTGAVHLPPTITKRRKSRTVYGSRRVLRGVHHYIDIERDALVQRKLAAGAYASRPEQLLVRSAGRHALTLVDSGSKPYKELSIDERRRLGRLGGSTPGAPLWLWLGEDGTPLTPSAWQAVFRAANARCERFGLDVRAHPHALRHTFAVHMLGHLLRQTVRAMRREPGETLMSERVKRLLIGDPLRRLQILLGHRHRETVFIYLDVLDEAQEIVLAALRDWDDESEALSRVHLELAS